MFPRIVITLVVVLFFVNFEMRAQSRPPQPTPPEERIPVSANLQPDLVEISLGYNYIHLGDAYPETQHLHGVDLSAFINATPWLAVGGDFMANFGENTVRPRFFLGDVNIDSERLIYVFGPRFTLWRNPRFKIFAEALAGGVHAQADVSLQAGAVRFTRTASADAFAMAFGGGFDWRLSEHLSWRVLQADYLPTDIDSQWQNNFRATTGIVYSFGRR